MKPDKGNGVVVMDRKDYDTAIFSIINDTTKFKHLTEDPTQKREGNLQRLLRNLKKKGFMNSKDYDNMYPSGSQPARIYGTPKMHKFKVSDKIPSLRPIVSSIGTYNYQLAKFLGGLIAPHLPNDYCVQDSFTFVQDLQKVSAHNKFLVSFDVCSLFTNIPLEETIDLAVQTIFTNTPNIKITRVELKQLFMIATSKTHFLYQGSFYDQVDGVAMGSPLAPILANLFMGFHEKEWIEQYTGRQSSYYRRYVDDIFAIFDCEDDANNFFTYLNSKHPNIKFTIEREVNNTIAFLDVLLNNTDSKLHTSVYHKKTYTGLLTNYFSFSSPTYKIGLIRTLIDRTFKINNTWTGFHDDLTKLKENLKKNQFPSYVIDNHVSRYLNKKLDTNTTNDLPDTVYTRYFKLPYVGPYSQIAQDKIRCLIKKCCKPIEAKLVFNSFKIRDAFSTKDKIPMFRKSSVIYKFTCVCKATYIGETSRRLNTRIAEHLGKDKNSHVFKHLLSSENCKSHATEDSFIVLDSAPTNWQRRIKEGLYILWENPTLNKQLTHVSVTISV